MGTKKRKRRRRQNNMLVLELLILVAVVLVVFEGKLIYTMFTHNSSSTAAVSSINNKKETLKEEDIEVSADTTPAVTVSENGSNDVADVALAGLSAMATGTVTATDDVESNEPVDDGRISEVIDSPSVVKKQSTPVDDSFFSNSVFIGDSRMMGFRNTSGITQGTFLTSVGLSTGAMSDQVIASSEGNISVYQGLSGRQYDKIYLMLGTNDLGYYPWENFKPGFSNIIQQFHKLQPDAIIYVCSVIYLDEAKTIAATSYNNNDNVRKVNGYQLEVCEELDYCYYLNLNEIFTNGYGSLIPEASSDGIHLYDDYCKQMLTYMKEHYIPQSAFEQPEETEFSTEGSSEPESEAI